MEQGATVGWERLEGVEIEEFQWAGERGSLPIAVVRQVGRSLQSQEWSGSDRGQCCNPPAGVLEELAHWSRLARQMLSHQIGKSATEPITYGKIVDFAIAFYTPIWHLMYRRQYTISSRSPKSVACYLIGGGILPFLYLNS